ncbi:MAG TPA: chemotaxis protein CheW [Cyanobacteria bacterium UBA11149]|nr:chemotaxis protein CheW [Cyanobacteria bacterium UBA11367]HBE58405.1 chemotaxis protein CheW [Cyanobacteria bacterium UBA11366]HBK62719.1 chemotaxis protein CheW [Cyanobacteria bacterium UBA11166]HBR75161.1 chemotaxis protein CheW [Cyanobacteria bacterium UBA11159]HBS69841.1 chemotaxis protein CheW [Cyanobacteria bacterium UBA11153]HBW91780.1 chemotaxis protein CheW [Cyanobacteria bacterium UBA11149]HCA93432.1 chemotaxis protein CheW [Cyanobacteria bacterium UBA9226]
MKEQSYCTFRLNNSIYGIENSYIEEVFALPELTVVSSPYRNLAGVVNLRGKILPVMDLNLVLGMPSPDYQITDSILVLRWEDSQVGIIVNEVYKEKTISPDQITTQLSNHRDVEGKDCQTIIADFSQRAGDILILNHPETWMGSIEIETILSKIPDNSPGDRFRLLTQESIFCPKATPEERIIFQERADNLKAEVTSQDLTDLKPISAIVLNDRFFGIDLAMVREFTDLSRVTPIPCCPKHIIGNMNLRGEIITLIDLRGFFHLPIDPILEEYKVMVVDFEGIVFGVIVTEVAESMLFLKPSEIMPLSTGSDAINDEYLQGVASYRENARAPQALRDIAILDLPKILLNGGLIVDEVV